MYFSLMPEPTRSGLTFDELLELEAGHVVVDQRGVAHFLDGAVVVVVVGELVAGADHFHAQILVRRR
jgi:hypothetical protein